MTNLIEKINEKLLTPISFESTVNFNSQIELSKYSLPSSGVFFYVDSLSDKDWSAFILLELHSHNERLISNGLTANLGKK